MFIEHDVGFQPLRRVDGLGAVGCPSTMMRSVVVSSVILKPTRMRVWSSTNRARSGSISDQPELATHARHHANEPCAQITARCTNTASSLSNEACIIFADDGSDEGRLTRR